MKPQVFGSSEDEAPSSEDEAPSSEVCGLLPYVEESGTGHSCPLDGSADTMGGWGYLLGS